MRAILAQKRLTDGLSLASHPRSLAIVSDDWADEWEHEMEQEVVVELCVNDCQLPLQGLARLRSSLVLSITRPLLWCETLGLYLIPRVLLRAESTQHLSCVEAFDAHQSICWDIHPRLRHNRV